MMSGRKVMEKTTIAVTMAGLGQRFVDSGYEQPKYELDVRGKTLFEWACQSLGSWFERGSQAIFVVRAGVGAEDFVTGKLGKVGLDACAIVELDGPTDGQATSALMAGREVADPTAPFLVYNIDTHVRQGVLQCDDVVGDGWIPVFEGQGNAWSFVAPAGSDSDDNDRVAQVWEKVRVSDLATIGLYWFRSYEIYAATYQRHFSSDENSLGERYVAPLYNTMIQDGQDVRFRLLPSSSVVPLGTPTELKSFELGA